MTLSGTAYQVLCICIYSVNITHELMWVDKPTNTATRMLFLYVEHDISMHAESCQARVAWQHACSAFFGMRAAVLGRERYWGSTDTAAQLLGFHLTCIRKCTTPS